MSEADPEELQKGVRREDESVLRAKYLDYCSAQLSDLLLKMSPDDIYVLAEKAGRAQGRDAPGSYGEMVRAATDFLAQRAPLPPFDVWVRDYRRNPEHYDAYLMGLWKTEADAEGKGATGDASEPDQGVGPGEDG